MSSLVLCQLQGLRCLRNRATDSSTQQHGFRLSGWHGMRTWRPQCHFICPYCGFSWVSESGKFLMGVWSADTETYPQNLQTLLLYMRMCCIYLWAWKIGDSINPVKANLFIYVFYHIMPMYCYNRDLRDFAVTLPPIWGSTIQLKVPRFCQILSILRLYPSRISGTYLGVYIGK